jgi:protein-S-isoprenylcysteine O-methyltransferase Ste14
MDGVVRAILCLGLVFRMLHLEAMRKRSPISRNKSFRIRLIKFFKHSISVFLVFQVLFLDLFPIADQSTARQIIGATLYLVGLAMSVMSRLQLGKNWVDMEDYQLVPEHSLITQGLYRYIRHPIYTGDFLLFVGLQLALGSWLVLAALLVIPISIRQVFIEEALLSQRFPDYHAYRLHTKRFIPLIF